MKRASLPQTIKVRGTVLHLVVGRDHKEVIFHARINRKKYRLVSIHNKNLEGKTDLHGQPYKDSVFIFVEP